MSIEKLYSLIRKKIGVEKYVKRRTKLLRNQIKKEVLFEIKEQVNEDFNVLMISLKQHMSQLLNARFGIQAETKTNETSRKLWELYKTLEILEDQLNRLSKI